MHGRTRQTGRWQAQAAAVSGMVLALAGCGGDGDGGGTAEPPPPTAARVEGLAAADATWGGAQVRFDCSDGSTAQVQAAPDGRYATTLQAASLPCLVHATPAQGEPLWSVASAAGTVNITPGSDWVVSRALRQSTAGLQPDRALLRALTPAAVARAQADVLQALRASGLGAEGDLITMAAGPVADALRASQLQVQAALASRGISPHALRHALALHDDVAALGDALQQGRLADALALPMQRSDGESMPQLASGLVSQLTGPADTMFAVNAEGSWRSTDGGRQWTYVNHVLVQVQLFRGRLWARDHGGPVVSDDGGASWSSPAGAPAGCRMTTDTLLATPGGSRLWFFPASDCADQTSHYFTDDGLRWQSRPWEGGVTRLQVMEDLGPAKRQPPQRRVFLSEGGNERVVSCLLTDCVESQVLDWPRVQALLPVEGSAELVAILADNRTGRPASMALSPDGIRWQAMTFMPFNSLYRTPQGDLLASPGANAVGGVNRRIQRSADNGRTWTPSDPAVNATEGWLTLGSDTRLRPGAGTSSGLQLSVDAGRSWTDLPTLQAQLDRRRWRRAPDGLLLRDTPQAVQASRDDGITWQDVLPYSKGQRSRVGPLWLDGRWVLIDQGSRLWTSTDGLKWNDGPLGLAGTPWNGWNVGELASDGGVWVMSVSWITTPHTPVQHALLESRDQGRTWSPSTRQDALAARCGGLRYLLRPRASDGALQWQMRSDADATWRDLPLPPGVPGTAATALECESGLLLVRVNGSPSSERPPYSNEPSGARGQSHWLSPDHGQHWFPVGRPGTDLFRVQNRWWSLGLDSVMLWP